jgi:hypothetical protein
MSTVGNRISPSSRVLRPWRSQTSVARGERDWGAWRGFLEELAPAGTVVLASVEANVSGHNGRVVALGRPLIAIGYSEREDLLSLTVTLHTGMGELRHLIRAPKLLRAERGGPAELELLVEDERGSRTAIGLSNIPDAAFEAMPSEDSPALRDAGRRAPAAEREGDRR